MNDDWSLLKHAVRIAADGIKSGSGPFGAIISKSGEVISEANNRVVQLHDPTAHAEILAIRRASELLETHDLSDCVIYTSCEPCPMCLGAIYWSGIKKVVYAADRYDAAGSGFSDSTIYNEISLNPAERKIQFVHITNAGGKEVFKKWDDFEGKIPY